VAQKLVSPIPMLPLSWQP